MSTLNIPAPTISLTVDADGTTHVDSSQSVTLTPQEAVEAANFIITSQPGYVPPVADEGEPVSPTVSA